MLLIFSTPGLIRHLWKLNIVVLLMCLLLVVLLMTHVTLQIVASLTDNSSCLCYDHNMFIVQASLLKSSLIFVGTGWSPPKVWTP